MVMEAAKEVRSPVTRARQGETMKTKLNAGSSGHRLNIVLPEQTMERIGKIKDLTAASSVTDVIRTAILTYEALAEFLAEGNKFYLQREADGQLVPVQFLFDVKRLPRSETVQPERVARRTERLPLVEEKLGEGVS
jgi:hypothetical protein